MLRVAGYLKVNDFQRRDARDVIEEFSDEIAGICGSCIDIGCGPGNVTKDLLLPRLGREATIFGADLSEGMINFARNEYRNEKRLSFGTLDIQSRDLPNEHVSQYDHAFSSYCVHWCQDTRRVFENIYKLLRPGGKSLMLFLASHNIYKAFEVVISNFPKYEPYMKDSKKYISPFHNRSNREESLRKILIDTGFKVKHCSVREKTFCFKNVDAMKELLANIDPSVERMPSALKEEYIKDAMKEILTHSDKNEEEDTEQIIDTYYTFVIYIEKPARNN